jgi:hypothetical protein
LKAVVGADDRILGFTAFCAEASEAMAVVQTAMIAGMPYTTLRDTIYTHPTISEGLVVLFTRRSFITGFWRPNALKSSMNPLALQLQSAFCNCV